MPTPTAYGPYDIDNLTNGQVNPSQLQSEISADPDIAIAVQGVETVGGTISQGVVTGGEITVTFQDVLPAGQKLAWDGGSTQAVEDPPGAGSCLALHDAQPNPETPVPVEIEPEIGKRKTDVDGVNVSATASSWGTGLYTLPEDYHLQGLECQWQNMQLGDYAFMAMYHPGGTGALGATASSGQKDVTVGSGKGAYYAAASYLEIWDSSGNLKECRAVASVSGDVVTLESNLVGSYDTTHVAWARVNGHSPVRGTYGIDGGKRLIGTTHMMLRNEVEITDVIPAGLVIAVRLSTTEEAATRKMAVNFIFRKPLA